MDFYPLQTLHCLSHLITTPIHTHLLFILGYSGFLNLLDDGGGNEFLLGFDRKSGLEVNGLWVGCFAGEKLIGRQCGLVAQRRREDVGLKSIGLGLMG